MLSDSMVRRQTLRYLRECLGRLCGGSEASTCTLDWSVFLAFRRVFLATEPHALDQAFEV